MDDPKQAGLEGEDLESEISELTEGIERQQPHTKAAPDDLKPGQHPLIFPLTIVLVIFAMLLTFANIAGLGPFRRMTEPLNSRSRVQQQDLDMLATIGYIEAFYNRHNRLPGALEEMGIELSPGISYEVVGELSYTISAADQEPRLFHISPGERED